MEYNRNFFIAIALSFALIFVFQYLYPQTPPPVDNAALHSESHNPSNAHGVQIPQEALPEQAPPQSRAMALEKSKRLAIDTPTMQGSLNLKGAVFDDISLKNYKTSIAKDAANIQLLNPVGLPTAYIAEFGFSAPPASAMKLPQGETPWQVEGSNKVLTPKTPITLTYTNPDNIVFRRKISVDNAYLFTIEDHITNNSHTPITLYNYSRIARSKAPVNTSRTYILHEGPLAMVGQQGLQSESYGKMQKLDKTNPNFQEISFQQDSGGWVGITDKYWAVVAVPEQNRPFKTSFKYFANLPCHFQSDFLTNAITIAPNATKTITNRLFSGAKEVDILNHYQDDLHIQKFDLLIDWGIFALITKPMFFLIDWWYKLLGNFGLSIIAVTILLKILTFPLSHKSFSSSAKMRLLQPKIAQIKAKYKDMQEQQKAMMALYREEKVNPFAGCLPILIQMPIFFALYKVLYITIEMRHAPFFGWIHDLAAPDPTSIFNLFGALPYHVPQFLMIGAWPILMGLTMFIQMRFTTGVTDPMQARLFTWLPLIFTFMLASFPVGLVIYWACNNTLTIIQQTIFMKRHNMEIPLWQSTKTLFGKISKKS